MQSTSKPTGLWALTIGAIGVVYGDVGTSPLYAFREALHAVTEHGQAPTEGDVLGILSLVIWSLMVVVTVKYVTVLLRFDNQGEGGTLALMALVRSGFYGSTMPFLFLGMASAAMFFGDAMITPAISVLSAVEGLKVVAPASEPFILPITVLIIITLFVFQSRGTAKMSAFFGPITVIWFAVMALLGVMHIGDYPAVIKSLNPVYGIRFLVEHSGIAFIILGAVFLSVTGAEALYTDLGHFGRKPIQIAWIWFIFPALVLNYFGQGAMVLKDASTMDYPFFKMAAAEHQLPLVILATLATIIASQAVITGAFSLARQAVNLGLLPRLVVKYTSDVNTGQIYLPQINYMLMIGVLLLVAVFKSSGALAAAYGISVTGAMFIDAIMIFFVVWRIREWSIGWSLLFVLPFMIVDSTFLFANLLKIADGAWMPLSVAAVLMVMMVTWVNGTIILNGRARKRDVKVEKFIESFDEKYKDVRRVPGTAFFLSGDPNLTPAALVQNLRHNHVLHEKNILLSVKIDSAPYVPLAERWIITRLNDKFSQVVLRFGFKDIPDVQEELIRLNRAPDVDITFDWEETSVFLNRRVLRAHPRYGLPIWQDLIYMFMNKFSSDPADFYKLPTGRVIEIGRHVVI